MEVDKLTPPFSESGTRTYDPNVATHKKPKKPVMIFELPHTARTRKKNSNEVDETDSRTKDPMIYKSA